MRTPVCLKLTNQIIAYKVIYRYKNLLVSFQHPAFRQWRAFVHFSFFQLYCIAGLLIMKDCLITVMSYGNVGPSQYVILFCLCSLVCPYLRAIFLFCVLWPQDFASLSPCDCRMLTILISFILLISLSVGINPLTDFHLPPSKGRTCSLLLPDPSYAA